jgi:hypothetical protein
MSSKGKRKWQELDLKTRYEVIKFSAANPKESTRKLAEKFGCGRTQIQNILLKRDEILSAFETNSSSDTKRSRGGKNAEFDSALLAWFRKARSKNVHPYIWSDTTRKSHANCQSFRCSSI